MDRITYLSICVVALLVVGGTPSSGFDAKSCSAAADAISDYLIERFLSQETVHRLPNATVAILRLSNLTLEGLHTIGRRCSISIDIDDNNFINAQVCIGAKNIRVSMNVKASLIFKEYNFKATLDIHDFNGLVNARVLLEAGRTVELGDLKIHDANPVLKFSGSLGGISSFINDVMKTRLKNMIVGLVAVEVKNTLQTFLNENPLYSSAI